MSSASLSSAPPPSASEPGLHPDDLLAQLERLHLTHPRRARHLVTHALAQAQQPGEEAVRARCLMWQGILHCQAGRYRRALAPLSRALALASQVGDVATQARIQNCFGIAHTELGQYARALEHHLNNLKLVQEQGDFSGRLRALINIGALRSELGDPAQGLAHQREALQMARQMRASEDGLLATLNVTLDLSRLGRHAQAIRAGERALGLSQRLGHPSQEAQVRVCLAGSLIALGRFSEAEVHARAGLAVVEAAPQGNLDCELRLLLGQALAQLGDVAGARALWTQAVEQAAAQGYRKLAASAHSALAEALREENPALAYTHLSRARTLEHQLHGEETRQRAQAKSAELAVERYRHQAQLERVRREELAELNTRLMEAQGHLTHLAEHDALTGLANRLQFDARLDAALADVRSGGSGLAVLFIDLDHFKRVNDTLGHDAGDVLLREVAGRLKGSLRAGDLVARLGGDEFAVLLPGVADAACAERMAAQLVVALERPFALLDRELRIGASVGMALAPRDGQDPVGLKQRADTAMYRMKHAGRGAAR